MQRPHFSHHQGGERRSCFETALHRMGKQIVTEARAIRVPVWERRGPSAPDLDGNEHGKKWLTRQPALWSYTEARQDVRMGEFTPDVELTDQATGKQLLVEILVHHRVDTVVEVGGMQNLGWGFLSQSELTWLPRPGRTVRHLIMPLLDRSILFRAVDREVLLRGHLASDPAAWVREPTTRYR